MSNMQMLRAQQGKQAPLNAEMKRLMAELHEILANPTVEAAYNQAISHVDPFVEDGSRNPWCGQTVEFFEEYFRSWFTFLPVPDGGLGKIIPFSYFYLNNPSAYAFLNTFRSRRAPTDEYRREIFDWIVQFVKVRGAFMDTEASAVHIPEWVEWLGPHIHDFAVPPGGFRTFNDFFTRALNPERNARPISAPDDSAIAVAPADAVINYIISDLTLTQMLDVKSRQLNVTELLDGSQHAPRFEGGTAICCVLLPESYHRYHAPVTGRIVEGKEVRGIYFGITDGDDFLNDFNFGQGTTDFSVFEDFHRAYYVIDTGKHGLVAVVPVGLNTISSITPSLICERSSLVAPGEAPIDVAKGQELGHFAYGGSMVLLLFQKGVFPAVSVLMGSRIGGLGSPADGGT